MFRRGSEQGEELRLIELLPSTLKSTQVKLPGIGEYIPVLMLAVSFWKTSQQCFSVLHLQWWFIGDTPDENCILQADSFAYDLCFISRQFS